MSTCLPASNALTPHEDVQRVWRADEYCIKRIISDDCVVILCPARYIELSTLMLETVFTPAADDTDLKVVALHEVREVHPADDAACTDHTKLQCRTAVNHLGHPFPTGLVGSRRALPWGVRRGSPAGRPNSCSMQKLKIPSSTSDEHSIA